MEVRGINKSNPSADTWLRRHAGRAGHLRLLRPGLLKSRRAGLLHAGLLHAGLKIAL